MLDVFVFGVFELLLLTFAEYEWVLVLKLVYQILVNVGGKSDPICVTRLVKLRVKVRGQVLVEVEVAHSFLVGYFLRDFERNE